MFENFEAEKGVTLAEINNRRIKRNKFREQRVNMKSLFDI